MSNFSCPNAGPTSWYVCGGGSKFAGCCLQNPCPFGCLAGNLYAASVNSEIVGEIPNLQCEAGVTFYQCSGKSSFWGCCKSNPCASSSGCASTDLRPATFINEPAATAAYSPSGVASSSAAVNSGSGSSTSTGAIIGGAVGGGVGAILIAVLVFCVLRRRRRRKQKKAAEATEMGEESENGVSGPAELSTSKSVRRNVPDTPPPRFSELKTDGPVYELEDNPNNPRALSELMSKDLNWPAEVEADSAPSTRRNSRRLTDSSISTNVTRQSVDESLPTSPQSESFTEGAESNGAPGSPPLPSPPRVPGSPPPRVPNSPPPAYPPTIPEDGNSDEENNR